MRSQPALRLRAQVLELLRLPVDRPAAKLRAAAMRVAERSIEARALQPKQEGGGLYGWQAADTLYALAPVVSPAAAYDLLLAARRDGNGERRPRSNWSERERASRKFVGVCTLGEWELTHVSLAEPAETQVRLTRGGLATGDSLAIAQAAVAEMIGAAESLPLAPSTRGAGRGGERRRA